MQNINSRIDPTDAVVLFVDLQTGIVELSKTIDLDRAMGGRLSWLPYCSRSRVLFCC